MRLTGGLTKMPRDAGRDNVPSAAATAGAGDAALVAALRPSNGMTAAAGGEGAASDEALVKRLRGGDGGGRRGKLRLVQIGQKRFRYRKARKAVIRVRLTLEGRRLNKRHKRLRIRASAPVRFGNGRRGVAKRRFWMLKAKPRR